MFKIEDIKKKNYQEIFQKSQREKNKFIFNFPGLNLVFKIVLFLFIFTLSFNVVAAPLNLPVAKVLDPETQKKKESLESELQRVLKQIEEYKKTISNIQKQKRSIQNDLKIVESNIKKVELEIKAIDLSIQRLSQKIRETKKTSITFLCLN